MRKAGRQERSAFEQGNSGVQISPHAFPSSLFNNGNAVLRCSMLDVRCSMFRSRLPAFPVHFEDGRKMVGRKIGG
jgi:hypothetical protein